MKKYQKELLETKTKYELNFKETITDNYKKRQAIHFFVNGFGISIINIKNHDGMFSSYTKSEEEYEIADKKGRSIRIRIETFKKNRINIFKR